MYIPLWLLAILVILAPFGVTLIVLLVAGYITRQEKLEAIRKGKYG